jgi:Secretion system C-terminal sorting domain
MKQRLLLLVLAFSSVFAVNAQRYFTPQFTGVTKSTVAYGQNFTALTLSVTGHTARQPLAGDIYQPTGDTAALRPAMIFLSTSNFLPKSVRRNPLGDRTDSCAVEFCNRFAKLGFVSMAIDYRMGWNPIASTQTDRIYGLINASYRGIQDGRAAIRYLKANAATLKIDTTRIMVIGEGTGAYISLGMAAFNKYSEILTTQYPQGKFTVSGAGGSVIPMVVEAYNGNIWGTAPDTATKSPVGYPYPVGDTLFVPNLGARNVTHRLTVNMGGAMGDITWVDSASTPLISIATPHDLNAPYRTGVLGVGIGGGVTLPVVEVQGSHWVSLKLDSLGVNNAFKKITAAYDPYKALVAPRNGTKDGFGLTNSASYASGLFPILGRGPNDSAPYQWWSTDTVTTPTNVNPWGRDSAALAGNPGMGGVKARAYIDSIFTFMLPRICVGMNLPCAGLVTGTEELLQSSSTKLTASPNPARTAITFESEVVNPMQAIQLFDMAGRQVMQVKVNSHNYTLSRNGLPAGMYVAKVKFEGGILTKKVVFEE